MVAIHLLPLQPMRTRTSRSRRNDAVTLFWNNQEYPKGSESPFSPPTQIPRPSQGRVPEACLPAILSINESAGRGTRPIVFTQEN